ncbi:MAG: YlbF family regulator [Syntrophomonadaceae bacterium]|nr:YlbF family regulator [Syntrophomonadaceae bacterium]
MSTEQIIKMAMELGISIAQSEEMDLLKAMQAKLMLDPEASALIGRYQEAHTQMENKMRDGLQVLPNEEQHLDILQQQLSNQPTVKEMIEVQERFNNLMQSVYFAINQAISGDSCSSDCSTCGGGCGM